MRYLEYTFSFPGHPSGLEILVAFLDAYGYEGFQETGDQLTAYLPEKKRNDELLKDLLERAGGGIDTIIYSCKLLPETNWNARWESDFQPIEVEDFVRIRASFHQKKDGFVHDILIDPKMSFGTGHHATTRLMIRAMKSISFMDHKVADLGCGTAVLSILASRMMASEVIAVDIDEWAINNAQENIENNHCSNITVKHGDLPVTGHQKFDVILANINRNILLQYMSRFYEMLNSDGTLVLSGIMLEDKDKVSAAAESHGLHREKLLSENDWCALVFRSGK